MKHAETSGAKSPSEAKLSVAYVLYDSSIYLCFNEIKGMAYQSNYFMVLAISCVRRFGNQDELRPND